MFERYNDIYNLFWEFVGFSKFMCIGIEKFGETIEIILFLVENVFFKIFCNYSVFFVDIDFCEVLSYIVNLFLFNKFFFLVFLFLKRLFLFKVFFVLVY